MKKTTKILCLILTLVLCIPLFVSCEAKTLITYEDKTLSVNVYEFLLSRMKGTLAYYGYEVDKTSFWKTVVSLEDGTTYNDYFRATIMQQAVYYVVADKMFDENNLTLTDAQEKKIDDLLSAYVKKAGSKSKLNEELKDYGVNYEILRDVLILEAKIELLKDHLYGEKGEKISVKKIILDIVKNPLIIGIFAALVCVAVRTFIFEKVGIEFRLSDIGPLFVVLQYLANLAIPLALLVLGAQFEFSAVAALKKEIIFGTVTRTVIVPALVIGVAFAFFRERFTPAHFATLVAAFATPVAVPSVPMVQEMGGDLTLAGQLVVWSTLASALTVFLFTFLLRAGGAF